MKESLQAPYQTLPCWSLYAAKNIGTGEGGMVTTDNDELAERVRMIRTHGEKIKYESLMLVQIIA